MAHKELKYDVEARRSLEDGVNAVANAVKVALGPEGRYVVIDKKFGAPTIANDGVSIAREIEIEDPFNDRAPSSCVRWPRYQRRGGRRHHHRHRARPADRA